MARPAARDLLTGPTRTPPVPPDTGVQLGSVGSATSRDPDDMSCLIGGLTSSDEELTAMPGSQRGASSIGPDGWDPDCRYGLVPVPVAPLMPVAGRGSALRYNCSQFILSRPPAAFGAPRWRRRPPAPGQAILSCSSPKSAMCLRVPPRAVTKRVGRPGWTRRRFRSGRPWLLRRPSGWRLATG